MKFKYSIIPFNLDEVLSKKTFSVPNFQRGIVWPLKKRKEFINVLISGQPFGTILVYKNSNNDNVLIDGLQRISTIRDFHKNPYKYLDNSIIDEECIRDLIRKTKKIYREHGVKTTDIADRLSVDRLRYRIFNLLKENKDYIGIRDNLLDYLKLNLFRNTTGDFERTLKEIIDGIEEKIDLKGLNVYALSYTGDEDDLPTIFHNLNVGGVKPSKYEVLASIWPSNRYKGVEQKIINRIYDRYEKIGKSGNLKITIKKDDLKKEGITLFEYCHAIGSMIMDQNNKYVSFVGKSNNETEPVGFEIICLLLDLKVIEAHKIADKLSKAPAKFLNDLKKTIFEILDKMYDALEEWVYSERGDPIYIGSNYMIYHMFMAYARMNYKIDCEHYKITPLTGKIVNEWNENYNKNLHFHYLYDYLSNYWGGSNRQVSNLMALINDEKELYRYSAVISDDRWRKLFADLKEIQLYENPYQVNTKSKLFLDYLIKFKIKDNPRLKTKYFKTKDTKEQLLIDIEHIIPEARVKKQYALANASISGTHFSSIGNLCYLTAKVNRGKREHTIYEDQENRPGYIINPEFVNFVDYPLEDEIAFINESFEVFSNKFNDFMSDRYDKLVEEFMELKR